MLNVFEGDAAEESLTRKDLCAFFRGKEANANFTLLEIAIA